MIKCIEKVGLNGSVYFIADPESLKEHQEAYLAELRARLPTKPKPYYGDNDPGAYAGGGYYSHDPDCVSN